MGELSQIQRIIRILELFSMGRRVTTQELYDFLKGECSLRTIQRDIQAIQYAGIPLMLEKSSARENYWFFPREYRQMVVPVIQHNELLAMHILKAHLKTFRGTKIERQITGLFNKLEELVPGDIYLDFDEDKNFIWDQNQGLYNYGEYDQLLSTVIELILARNWVTVTYRASEGKPPKTYDLFLYRIFLYNGSIYIAAYNPAFDNFISLALHRLEQVQPARGQRCQARPFSLAEFCSNRFGVFVGEIQRLQLSIRPEFVHYFQNRSWHPTQKTRLKKDKSMLLEMKVPLSPELITWILGWHTAIKVLRPDSLKAEITKKLQETLEQYI